MTSYLFIINLFINLKMSINVSFILDQFDDYSDGNSIKCSTETFREILNQKSNLKNKRTKCSYFVWLDENRSRIKDEYFGDFENVTDWSFENKKNYYSSKDLPLDKVVKDGKPRIVSLITTKAGILWKALSDSERIVYEEKANALKENTERVVVEQKPKKKRGRPKKNTVSNTIVEAVVEQFKDENKTEESNVLKVEEIEYNGKTYYLDINNNDIYDPESSELVGKREQGKINIKC